MNLNYAGNHYEENRALMQKNIITQNSLLKMH